MLADVLTCIWVTMAAVLGWRRRAGYEMMSLVSLALAYAAARGAAIFVGPVLGNAAKIGPVGGLFLATASLWLIFYIAFLQIAKRLPREAEAGVRIEVDEDGNPVVRGGVMPKIGGVLIGAGRGLVLFLGVVSLLVVLVPSFLYKDGRGTAMIQPKSLTMKTIKQWEPTLRAMEDVTKGLRSLQYLRANRKARMQAIKKHPELKKLYEMEKIQRLRQDVKLLSRANKQRQGKRDATLLLWIPSYQSAVLDPEVVHALGRMAVWAPAPFDRYKDKGAPKKKSGSGA